MKRKKQRTTSPPVTLADLGEDALLRRIRRLFASEGKDFAVGIGDDAAAIAFGSPGELLVATTDSLIEGVHFARRWIGPADLGARALAVNLSDLAAMAATPVAALLALSVPPETPLTDLNTFFRAMRDEGRRHGCPIAGGDMTRAPQWTVAVTVFGRPAVKGRVVQRNTARPGQTVYVTGRPGESGAGLEALRQEPEIGGITIVAWASRPCSHGRDARATTLIRRHRRPTPRLREAAALARACRDLSMMDVSDGVWCDAGRLAEASGVRIDLEANALPITRPLARLGRQLGRDPLDWVLFGGEDYELLFATSRKTETLRAALDRAGIDTPIHPIGRVTAGSGVRLIAPDGRPIPVADGTFQHFPH